MQSVGGRGAGRSTYTNKKIKNARAAHFFENNKRHTFSQERRRRRKRRRRVRVGKRRTARVNL